MLSSSLACGVRGQSVEADECLLWRRFTTVKEVNPHRYFVRVVSLVAREDKIRTISTFFPIWALRGV